MRASIRHLPSVDSGSKSSLLLHNTFCSLDGLQRNLTLKPSKRASEKFREEVLNTKLADILRDYGLAANPEVITSSKLPDVKIVVGGLKIILEGKIETQVRQLEKQAKARLTSGLADISIAIDYAKGLNEAEDVDALKTNMAAAKYDGVIYHWGADGIKQIPLEKVGISDLVEILNRVYTLYTKNDLLITKIKEIDECITSLTGEGRQTSLTLFDDAVEGRLRAVLGIGDRNDQEEGK